MIHFLLYVQIIVSLCYELAVKILIRPGHVIQRRYVLSNRTLFGELEDLFQFLKVHLLATSPVKMCEKLFMKTCSSLHVLNLHLGAEPWYSSLHKTDMVCK